MNLHLLVDRQTRVFWVLMPALPSEVLDSHSDLAGLPGSRADFSACALCPVDGASPSYDGELCVGMGVPY